MTFSDRAKWRWRCAGFSRRISHKEPRTKKISSMPEVAEGQPWKECGWFVVTGSSPNVSKLHPSQIPLQGDQCGSIRSCCKILQVSPGCWCTKKASKFTKMVRSIQIHCTTVLWLSDLWARVQPIASRDDRTDSKPWWEQLLLEHHSISICKILQQVCAGKASSI